MSTEAITMHDRPIATVPTPAGLPGWPAMLRPDLAADYIGVSRATLSRMRDEGRVPEPETLSTGRDGRPTMIAWRRDALDQWLASGRPTVDQRHPTRSRNNAR